MENFSYSDTVLCTKDRQLGKGTLSFHSCGFTHTDIKLASR